METLVNRYALALLSIAVEEHNNENYRLLVKDLYNSFNQSEDLKLLLKSTFVSKDEKKNLFKTMLNDIELKKVLDFVLVIIDNGRSSYLLPILEEFIKVSNNYDNISEGIIYSTIRLSEKEIEKITNAIAKKLNKSIHLHNRLDSSLIGGVKVVIDDHVFDGSIKNKLNNLKTQLEKGA